VYELLDSRTNPPAVAFQLESYGLTPDEISVNTKKPRKNGCGSIGTGVANTQEENRQQWIFNTEAMGIQLNDNTKNHQRKR